MKILYIYSGFRKVKSPDTQLYGLNHFAGLGVEAFHKDTLFRKIFGFRISHFLMYFIARNYDIVFGSSILYMMFWRKFIKSKAKFVLFNVGFTRTIAGNKGIKLWIINWLLKEIDGIVCLSHIQMDYLKNYATCKLFFVPLGVDEKFYKPIYDRKDYFLSVGRDNGRDYETLVRVAEELPQKEFHFVCSRRNIKMKNIPSNVKIFYDLDFKDVVVKYSEANVLLLITHDDKHYDGSDCSGQTVLLEAMASGLPVIVSRKKYLKDYIKDREHAFFVDFYNVKNIISAIGEIDKVRVAKNARELIERQFTTEKMARRLLDVFQNI